VSEKGMPLRGQADGLEAGPLATFAEFLCIKSRQAEAGQSLDQAADGGGLATAGRAGQQEVRLLGGCEQHHEHLSCNIMST
jgi:hypothetical protein